MKNKIKEKFDKFLDVLVYKDQIRLLQKRVKELEEERKPLIDLKNKYLSEMRGKNLQIGQLKKKLEEKEQTIYKLNTKNMNLTFKEKKENENN